MKNIFIVFCILLTQIVAFAQNDSVNLAVQTNFETIPKSSARDSNGNLYIAGIESGNNQYGKRIFITKVDSIGNSIFLKYPHAGTDGWNEIPSIITTVENEIVYGGTSSACDIVFTNCFLTKLNNVGDTMWNYNLNYYSSDMQFAKALIQLPDSSFFVSLDSSLIHINSQGDSLTTHHFNYGKINKMLRFSNGNFLIAFDSILVKTDPLFFPYDIRTYFVTSTCSPRGVESYMSTMSTTSLFTPP